MHSLYIFNICALSNNWTRVVFKFFLLRYFFISYSTIVYSLINKTVFHLYTSVRPIYGMANLKIHVPFNLYTSKYYILRLNICIISFNDLVSSRSITFCFISLDVLLIFRRFYNKRVYFMLLCFKAFLNLICFLLHRILLFNEWSKCFLLKFGDYSVSDRSRSHVPSAPATRRVALFMSFFPN